MSAGMKAVVAAVVALTLALIVVAVVAAAKRQRECEQAGGRWEIDHYYTRWTTMGKNEIPVRIDQPVYGCHR